MATVSNNGYGPFRPSEGQGEKDVRSSHDAEQCPVEESGEGLESGGARDGSYAHRSARYRRRGP
jgi:hypothetical protein